MTNALVQNATISAAEVREFHERGFVVLRNQFEPGEVQAVQEECDRLFEEYTEERDRHNLRVAFRNSNSGRPVLDRIDKFIDISPVLKELAGDPRMVQAASALLAEPAALFKDKLILKRPGTHGYGVHQDYTYWQEMPAPPELLLSVVFAVDDSGASNGGLELFPGMHREHYREREVPSEIFNPAAGLVPREIVAGREPELPILNAGDMIFFHALAPHQSGVNTSSQTRRSIYLSFAPERCGDVYSIYCRNFHGYLRKDRSSEGDLLHFR